jgi:predicted nucleic acid-binding protein
VAEIIEATPLHGVAPDPDDDVVIGTAAAARADFIITGDRRLLGVGQYGDVSIISAADAVIRLTA